MIGLFIALVVALGAGGTVAMSDNARPGDALFGVDQALENARLSLSAEEKKNELRVRFAEERIEEVKEIKTEQEARGNESNDEQDEESEEDIRIGLEAALNLITDVKQADGTEDPRLTALAQELSTYMSALPLGARVEVSDDKFRIKFDQGPEKIEIKEQGDNKTKIDVRTEEGRFKIEVKDGQIEVKTKIEDDDQDKDESKDELEVEAKILSDKTVIEVEINNEKTTFSSTATTETDIVAAVVSKFPALTVTQVKNVLEIEIEDEDDGDENDDEEDDEDEADEEDEDDEDEDRSGSNKDND